jgi:uncharacterized surface protein with fasciclin (FAS1) repeats
LLLSLKNEGKAKFMKVNYGNLLSKLAGFAGLAGVSLLISLPVGAQGQGTTGTLNPSPSIFNEPPYNRGHRVQPGDVTPSQPSGNTATPGQPMSPEPTIMPSQPGPGGATDTPTKPRRNRHRRGGGDSSVTPKPMGNGDSSTPQPMGSGDSAAPKPPGGSSDSPPTGVPSAPSDPATTPSNPSGPSSPSSSTPSSSQDIVALATANGSFKTLTAALEKAGLTKTLQGKGPFTVFAPTDKAFAELPKEALDQLMKPENKAILIKILTYHVVPGNVLSTSLKTGKVKTVEGESVNIKVDPSGVKVNNASVIQADIKASNGTIHVIDKVILPGTI